MPNNLHVHRDGGPRIELLESGRVFVGERDDTDDGIGAGMSPSDLLWLVTTGGPAMIALLGGPLEIKSLPSGDDGKQQEGTVTR